MDICKDGHGEVCFSETFCPACDAISETKDEITELKDALKESQTEASTFQDRVEELEGL